MTPSGQSGTIKHVPQRTCVACRQVKAKRDLVRLVRMADGNVEVDATGRKDGRGAYLCDAPECWDAAVRQGRLERVLRIALSGESRERLMRDGERVLRGVN
jgi:predicted RNA-binding protein YlxR (DUF448 family)